MKKILCFALSLIISVSLLTSFSAFAEGNNNSEPMSCSGDYFSIHWEYYSDSKTIVFSDNGSGKKPVADKMPYFEGTDMWVMEMEENWRPRYPWYQEQNVANVAENIVFGSSLTNIIDNMCYKFIRIKEVTIPSTVKEVGAAAFMGCRNLETINLPEKPMPVESDAFLSTKFSNNESNWEGSCLYLNDYLLSIKPFTRKNLVVRDGTKYIAKGAFSVYYEKEITLPESVEVLFENALSSIYIEKVNIPKNLKEIGENAFSVKLTEITLPKGLKKVAYNSFSGCKQLNNIYVDPDNPYFTSVGGVLFSKDKSELYVYPAGRNGNYYRVPNSVKIIHSDFKTQYYLKKLVIPKNVIKIDNNICAAVYFMGSQDRLNKISSVNINGARCCRAKISKISYKYNGKVKTPKVKVYDPNGQKLKKGKDYKLTVPKKSRDTGVYTVKIKLKGKYIGSINRDYSIVPRKTELKKTKPAYDSAEIRWKKQNVAITGYQIQYSKNKEFRYLTKTVNVKGKNKTSKVVNNLRNGESYYLRIRTYKKKNGKTVYSEWSKVKTFRTVVPL